MNWNDILLLTRLGYRAEFPEFSTEGGIFDGWSMLYHFVDEATEKQHHYFFFTCIPFRLDEVAKERNV